MNSKPKEAGAAGSTLVPPGSTWAVILVQAVDDQVHVLAQGGHPAGRSFLTPDDFQEVRLKGKGGHPTPVVVVGYDQEEAIKFYGSDIMFPGPGTVFPTVRALVRHLPRTHATWVSSELMRRQALPLDQRVVNLHGVRVMLHKDYCNQTSS